MDTGGSGQSEAAGGSMVSIWASGIEYANFSYDNPALSPTVYGFDNSENKNRNKGDDTRKWESVKRKTSKEKGKKGSKAPPDPGGGAVEPPPQYRRHVADDMVAPTWAEFTRTTTFHGMKYVFDGRPMHVRRLLWVIVVVTCITLFSIQVVNRISDFFDRNTNINVELQYVAQVEFPTVTICNQNTYRITATVDLGLYDFLDHVYGVDGINDIDSQDYNLDAHNYTSVVLTSAHQLHDFIDSCKWKGVECNISSDFVTTVTEFGVCYTFNAGPATSSAEAEADGADSPRRISHAGAGYGLSLILNIEQYEYMKGPQDEAGIKLLLHDRADVPLVKELGFAIAPGTHTLVGVNREVVTTLPQPYGTCVSEAPPRSHCITECTAAKIIERCGCRDVFMPALPGSTVCNMSTAYMCVLPGLHALSRDGEQQCQCHVPCSQTSFEPDLSYSHLSKLTVDRISLANEDKLKAVQESYQYARELSQRVNKVVAERDEEWLNGMLNYSNAYSDAITHSVRVLDDTQYLEQLYSVAHAIYVSYATAKADFTTIMNEYYLKQSSMNRDWPNVYRFQIVEQEIVRFLDLQDDISPLRIRLQECYDEQFVTQYPAGTTDDYYVCDDSKSGTYLSYRKTRMRYLRDYYAANAILEAATMEPGYQQLIDYLFTNTSRLGRERPEYAECMQVLNTTATEWLPWLHEIYNLSQVYCLEETDWETKIHIADRMLAYYNASHSNGSLASAWIYDQCNWYNIHGLTDKNFSLFQAHTDAAEKSYVDAQSILMPLISQGESLGVQYDEGSASLLEYPIMNYLNGDATKLDLYRHFHSLDFKVGWEVLSLTNGRYMEDYRQYISKVSDMENNIFMSLSHAFELLVPVMNDSVINNLETVRFARSRANTSAVIQSHLATLGVRRKASVLGLISAIYGDYRLVMQTVQSDNLMSFQNIDSGVVDMQDSLMEFAEENEINDDFFMENYIKIDIFYKEMSYSKVKQQISFEFLSLVSEIGGFMGLLLGASVLSMCELLDYLTLSTIRRMRKSQGLTAQLKYGTKPPAAYSS